MSYLLDALRKSELERRVGEVPDLTPDFSVQPPPKRRSRWIYLIVGLVAINLSALIYLTFFDREEPGQVVKTPIQSEPEAVQSSQTISVKPKPQPTPVVPVKPAKPHTPVKNKVVDQESVVTAKPQAKSWPTAQKPKPVLEKTPKSETMASLIPPTEEEPAPVQQKTAPKPVPKSAPVAKTTPRPKPEAISHQKPLQTKTADKQAPPELSKKQNQAEKVAVSPATKRRPKADSLENFALVEPTKPLQPAISKPKPTPPTPAPKTETIPLLTAMPRDFQREFPTLNVNVFVYSENPKERFVIVDMVKYVSGQKFANGAEILAIRNDSIVLKYRGQKFRVKRP